MQPERAPNDLYEMLDQVEREVRAERLAQLRGAIDQPAKQQAALVDLLDAAKTALPYVSSEAMVYSADDHGDRIYIADVLRDAIARAEQSTGHL